MQFDKLNVTAQNDGLLESALTNDEINRALTNTCSKRI